MTCRVVCENCGYQEEIHPKRDVFYDLQKKAVVVYASCFSCCLPEEPAFETEEDAFVAMATHGTYLSWRKRKWIFQNTYLPWLDEDEIEDVVEAIQFMEGR